MGVRQRPIHKINQPSRALNSAAYVTELAKSLDPQCRADALHVLRALVEWSDRLAPLVRLDPGSVEHPAVRYVSGSGGNILWLARHTVGGDAKVELLTRTAKGLPKDLGDGLRRLLVGVLPPESLESGRVLQAPTSYLAEGARLNGLLIAIAYATGAVLAAER